MKYLERSQAEEIFYSKFKAFTSNLGFSSITKKELEVYRNYSAQRLYDWGWVKLEVAFFRNDFHAVFDCSTRINEVERIVEKFIGETGCFQAEKEGDYATFSIPMDIAWPEIEQNEMFGRYSLLLYPTEESVLEFFNLFVFTVKEKIIPLWEKWCDIKVLDKLLTENDVRRNFRIFGSFSDCHLRHIIIPKLASNPNYEQIFSSLYQFLTEVSKTEKNYIKYPQVLENLYEYLKTVAPLA